MRIPFSLRVAIVSFGFASMFCVETSFAQSNKPLSMNWETLNLPDALSSPSALSVSGNGKIAAHISSQGEIIVWDVHTTQIIKRIAKPSESASAKQSPDKKNQRETTQKEPPKLPSAIALDSNGSQLAIGYLDARLVIYSLSENKVLREFKGHNAAISALAFSSSNETLASGADDGTTQVWQIKDGKRLHIFDSMYYGDISGAVGTPVAIAFYANDHRLVVNEWYRGQYDVGRRASIWDLDTGHEVDTLGVASPNNDSEPRAGMAVNPQTWQLIFTGEWIKEKDKEKNGLMLQSLSECKPAKQMRMGGYADTVAIDLQARWMAAIDAEALMLFKATPPYPVTRYAAPGKVIALQSTDDGNNLVSLVLREDPTNTKAKSTAPTSAYPDVQSTSQLKRSSIPTSYLQAYPSKLPANAQACPLSEQERKKQTFTAPTPTPKLTLLSTLSKPAAMLEKLTDSDIRIYPSPVVELFFASHEELLARYRGNDDSSRYQRSGIAQWNLAQHKLMENKLMENKLMEIKPTRLNFNDKFDETALLRGKATWYQAHEHIKDLLSQKELKTIDNSKDRDHYLYYFTRFDRESGLFFRRDQNKFDVFDESGRRKDSLSIKGQVLDFAVRNGRLAALFNKNKVYLWSSANKQEKVYPLQLELDEYDHPEELILSADGNYLRIALPSASGDGPTQYSVYRLSDGKVVGSGGLLTDFPANSNRVIVADQRQHRLAVWDYDEGKIIARLPRHRNRDQNGIAVTVASALSDNGRYLASASLDGSVRVWDLQEHLLIGELKLPAEALSLAFNRDAKRLAVGKGDGTIAIIEVAVQPKD